MSCLSVNIPIGLLRDPRLTYADKLIWIVMRLDSKDESISNVYSQTRLAKRTKLARGTVINAMERLAAAGWYDRDKQEAVINRTIDLEKWIKISAELFTSENLRPRDIVMYGLLQGEEFRYKNERCTYRKLGEHAHACVKTVRRAVEALQKADWLIIKREHPTTPFEYVLDSPSAKYFREKTALTKMRLSRPQGHGEAIAQAMVDLVAKPGEHWENARSNILTNPATGEMLELDMWIPEYRLAIEFNGQQHYAPTDFASAADVAKQQERDALKASLLKAKQITLVVLTAADLSIEAVTRKLRGLIPLRDLRWYQPMVNYLNRVGHYYQQKTLRLQTQTP